MLAGADAHHAYGTSIILAVEFQELSVLGTPCSHRRSCHRMSSTFPDEGQGQPEAQKQRGHCGQLSVGPQLAGASGLLALRAGQWAGQRAGHRADSPSRTLPAARDAGAAEAVPALDRHGFPEKL